MSTQPSQRELPAPIKTFLTSLLTLTFLCLAVEVICRAIFHLRWPYDWPLMPRQDPFRDFYLYRPRYAFLHTPAFFTFRGEPYLYPAPVALVYQFFYLLPHSTTVFLDTIIGTAFVASLILGRTLHAMRLSLFHIASLFSIVLLCAYPFYFEYEQANMEIIIWILVAGGVWAFFQNRGYAAATCFGIAAAMKIYPLIYLGLFLSRKQYRQPAVAVVVCVVTTLAGLWVVCPDLAVSWHGIQHGLAIFRQDYMLSYSAVQFDHSLFSLPKAALGMTKFLFHTSLPPGPEVLGRLLAVYLPTAALCGIVLYFTMIRRLPMINQVLCLTVASILLPPVSYDYTLLHLYIPWALLVLFALQTSGRKVQGLVPAFVCLAILFSPETEIILHQHSIAGQIKAIALLVLLIIGLRNHFPSSFDMPPAVA